MMAKKYFYVIGIILVIGLTFLVYANWSRKGVEKTEFQITSDQPLPEVFDVVLELYPGKVYSVNKTQITLPNPPGEEGSLTKDVWIVGIILDEEAQSKFTPKTNKVEVKIDCVSNNLIGITPLY